MLSESMMAELEYFSAMLLYGFAVSACYHPLLFFRTLVRHRRAVVDAEDILFLAAAGFAFFLVAYQKNDGILRWYAFAGTIVGGYAYFCTVSRVLERARKWILQKKGKPFKIKLQYRRKGRVSEDESSSPEHKSKRKKKKRS